MGHLKDGSDDKKCLCSDRDEERALKVLFHTCAHRGGRKAVHAMQSPRQQPRGSIHSPTMDATE